MSLNVSGGGEGGMREGWSVESKLIVYMTLSVLTVAECVLAGYITLTSQELRKRRSTFFSWCLVLSIGILASLSLVYVIVLLSVPEFTYRSVTGCRVRVAQRYLSTVSCFTLVSLSLDRYLAICWPLRYQELLTKARCYLLCAACWILPAVLLLLPCIDILQNMCSTGMTHKRVLLAYVAVYTIGAFATFVLYMLVALEFRQGAYRRRYSTDSGRAPSETYSREVAVVRSRTAKSALTVFMLYTVLSLPHTLLPVVARMDRQSVPKVVLEIGYIVHRFHLLLFLPIYAGTNALFLASLSAWGRVLWRRITCWTTDAAEMNRQDAQTNHHTEDDLL